MTSPSAPDPIDAEAADGTGDQRRLHDALRRGPYAPFDVAAASAQLARRAHRAGLDDIVYARTDSPVGELVVVATGVGVVAVGWQGDDVLTRVAERLSPRVLEAPARLDPVRRQLDQYFEHRRHEFDIAIDWSLVAGFRRVVLDALTQVRYGEVVTYGELARRVDRPRASRAVGGAMAANPIPIVVPCHRVVRSGGALGNYSGYGGVDTKRWLLELEGAVEPRLR